MRPTATHRVVDGHESPLSSALNDDETVSTEAQRCPFHLPAKPPTWSPSVPPTAVQAFADLHETP